MLHIVDIPITQNGGENGSSEPEPMEVDTPSDAGQGSTEQQNSSKGIIK